MRYQQENSAISADGVPIHYHVLGKGERALVFVHGWCCDRRCWDQQEDYFASDYTVVSINLAGHGSSGDQRNRWTMAAFGQDVVAVARQLGLEQTVLIGHSMGGPVILEAARHLPDSIIGLIGVETLWNVEQLRTPEQIAEAMAPFRSNYSEAARAFLKTMFISTSEVKPAEEIMADMLATPKHIAISALEEAMKNDGRVQALIREIKAPKTIINSAHWRATNEEAARRYGIDVLLMSGVGHFVMKEAPQTFNCLLDETVKKYMKGKSRKSGEAI